MARFGPTPTGRAPFRSRSALSSRLGLLAALVAAALLATAATVAVLLSGAIDAAARQDARRMMEGGLEGLRGDVERVAVDYSFWTDAHDAAMAADAEWLAENVGGGAMLTDAADAFAVGGGGLTVPLGWLGGEGGGAMERPKADAFIVAGREALTMRGLGAGPAAVSAFAWIDGELWVLAAAWVQRHDAASGDAVAGGPILVAGDRFDAAAAAALSAPFLIGGTQVAPERPAAADFAPLHGVHAPAAYLVWSPSSPGLAALGATAGPIVLALALAASAAVAFVLVAARSARRLEGALAEATAASSAKSEFIATLSHELRTPLTGIVGMLQLLGASSLTDRQRRFVEIAGRAAGAQVEMIEKLLDIGRIGAGRMTLSVAPFVPAEVVRDVTALLEARAVEKNVALTVAQSGEVEELLVGDRLALRQILVNLIGNALKFTDKGTVDVRMEGRAAAGGVALTVRVADTGPGVPADQQARIFEPFRQAEGADARQKGGAGIGLAVSRGLAELMGGRLALTRSSAEGSVFTLTVTLPAAPAGAVEQAA